MDPQVRSQAEKERKVRIGQDQAATNREVDPPA